MVSVCCYKKVSTRSMDLNFVYGFLYGFSARQYIPSPFLIIKLDFMGLLSRGCFQEGVGFGEIHFGGVELNSFFCLSM